MRESIIERHLVKRVKEVGGEVRKVKWIGRRGAPDRLVMLPYRGLPVGVHGGAIWVELKATGKEAEPHQVREHIRMQRMGQRVEVVNSIEAVDKLMGIE